MGKLSRFSYWLHLRPRAFITLRLLALLRRYGITPTKAKRRVLDCIKLLALYDCRPTFATPGRVIGQHGKFFRAIQDMGAEIAMHGYDHVDCRSLTEVEIRQQFERATVAFQRSGIHFEGFRCPYLGYTNAVARAIPDGHYLYSSNLPIWWSVTPSNSNETGTALFDTLRRLYRPESADVVISTPRMSNGLVEIPPSLPDDLQLSDGLRFGEEDITRTWIEILHRTHLRGELFVLLFHPESFRHCRSALEGVLRQARLLRPAVWVTQLRDINTWWREKSHFTVDVSNNSSGVFLRFKCTDRATILIRNINTREMTHEWHGPYRVLKDRTLQLPPKQLPFIGVSPTVPPETVAFLKEQGYFIDRSEMAPRCDLYLDASIVNQLTTPVQLINYLDTSATPLVRFWRWPNETCSALAVTGDLDALTLFDYALRIITL